MLSQRMSRNNSFIDDVIHHSMPKFASSPSNTRSSKLMLDIHHFGKSADTPTSQPARVFDLASEPAAMKVDPLMPSGGMSSLNITARLSAVDPSFNLGTGTADSFVLIAVITFVLN